MNAARASASRGRRDASATDPLGRREQLTFKANLRHTRHGWLRLTPAYSVHLVAGLLEPRPRARGVVLDPFCGTGTTALVCAERGIECHTTDINPFLLWLARAKTSSYTDAELASAERAAKAIAGALMTRKRRLDWLPALHRIEKWWSPRTLAALARARAAIARREGRLPSASLDLLKIAFCRLLIAHANVSFGHQSMSFARNGAASERGVESALASTWQRAVADITSAARVPLSGAVAAIPCDARDLRTALEPRGYDRVITSPPYPNRMSYIRELRPYMYWLGYLSDGRTAGELDWRAIGGTWGAATSNLARWTPDAALAVPFRGFERLVGAIAVTSPLLARYVERYFHDMLAHSASVFDVVRAGGEVHYVVGNSKFYDVLVPVEQIFGALFEDVGFRGVRIERLRKRSSKKELFEFLVSARKPGR